VIGDPERAAGGPVASSGVAPAGFGPDLRPRAAIRVTLAQVLAAGPPDLTLVSGDPAATVSGASVGTALLRPGDLFAALQGQRSHGIDFVQQAVQRGASAVLTDADAASVAVQTGLPTLVCADPRAAIGWLSAQIYGRPSEAMDVIGVTGTSGKTTTTFLVRAGLTGLGQVAGLIGTVGAFCGEQELPSALTTPEAPALQSMLAVLRERGAQSVAMEVSSHALALSRVAGVQFAVAGFTNLSQDHLDFHPDMASYFEAKAALFDGRAASAVVMVDDAWGQRLASRLAAQPSRVTASTTSAPADWIAHNVSVGSDGSTAFEVTWPGGQFAAGCRIPGAYNVANALLALALLAQLGLDPAAAAPHVAAAQVPGRMERIECGQPFLTIVDYSHKPAALEGALRALRTLTEGRLILVIGCGGERDTAKRPIMGRIGARDADVLIVTDDNPRSEDPAAIRSAMLSGASSVRPDQRAVIMESDRRARAIRDALAIARPGDTVLIAGKGHETGQEVSGVVHPFDDREVARESLSAAGYAITSKDQAEGVTG
jgi:UDP-N-acetylmuramoyl-L-alanyl-D-glutamate--2,6-diaminopimelate ligase